MQYWACLIFIGLRLILLDISIARQIWLIFIQEKKTKNIKTLISPPLSSTSQQPPTTTYGSCFLPLATTHNHLPPSAFTPNTTSHHAQLLPPTNTTSIFIYPSTKLHHHSLSCYIFISSGHLFLFLRAQLLLVAGLWLGWTHVNRRYFCHMLVSKGDLNYTLHGGWLLSNLWNPLLRKMQCVYLLPNSI